MCKFFTSKWRCKMLTYFGIYRCSLRNVWTKWSNTRTTEKTTSWTVSKFIIDNFVDRKPFQCLPSFSESNKNMLYAKTNYYLGKMTFCSRTTISFRGVLLGSGVYTEDCISYGKRKHTQNKRNDICWIFYLLFVVFRSLVCVPPINVVNSCV